jgi:Fur family ferric uptake transcriptional regulator
MSGIVPDFSAFQGARWYVGRVPMQELEGRLRDAGLRVTAPRVAVLRVLADSTDHPRVDQIIDRVRASGVPISTQAAYDVCEALHRVALAGRIELPGGPARYESRVGDNHHHLVCRSCGHTEDVDCAASGIPCLEPVDAVGFTVDEAQVTFWGTCPTCQSHNQERP